MPGVCVCMGAGVGRGSRQLEAWIGVAHACRELVCVLCVCVRARRGMRGEG